MIKKSLALCFLLLLSDTFCSECTEKTSLTDEEKEYDICYSLKTSSNEKVCMYDESKNRCVEKTCSDFPVDDCSYMRNVYDQEGPNYKKCIPKTDKSGCELVYCENLKSNCDRFSVSYPGEQCVLNSEKAHCELKRCSDLTSNCEQFIPQDIRYKCILNGEKTQCEIRDKECEEFDTDKCDEYSGNNDGRCILDSSSNKCKLIRCQDLSSSECSKFITRHRDQICAPSGNKCEFKTSCSELSKDFCEKVIFSNEGYKCSYSTENGCEFLSCEDLESNCGQFVPLDPLYKCIPDKEDGGCYLEYKDCEELSKGQCDLFNTEDNLEDVGKRCIEDDGKCVLDSKRLDISLFLLFLFLFLF